MSVIMDSLSLLEYEKYTCCPAANRWNAIDIKLIKACFKRIKKSHIKSLRKQITSIHCHKLKETLIINAVNKDCMVWTTVFISYTNGLGLTQGLENSHYPLNRVVKCLHD